MGDEILYYVLLEIAVILGFALFLRQTRTSIHKQFVANERADDLLRSVLTADQYEQLSRNGYLDIPSSRNPERIYRVPRAQGLVKVIEQGKHEANLCLQPREAIPDGDIVAMHKLMIEADEETYLHRANVFTPITGNFSQTWLNWIHQA